MRIQTYERRVGLDTDRSGMPQPRFDKTLANSIEGFGNTLSAVGERAMAMEKQKENFKAEIGYDKLQQELITSFDEGKQAMPEDGGKFHDDFMEKQFATKRDAFLNSLPQDLKDRFAAKMQVDAEKWGRTAAVAQRDQLQWYYRTQLNEQSNNLLNAIDMNPDGYDGHLARGDEIIDASGLDATEKAAAKLKWRDAAQFALANHYARTDPDKARQLLGGRIEMKAGLNVAPEAVNGVKFVDATGGKTRHLPITSTVRNQLASAAAATGPDISIKLTSGGQMSLAEAQAKGAKKVGKTWYLNGQKVRTGSVRHDHGESGDVVLMRNGKEVLPSQDKELYAKFLENAAAAGATGLGHYAWGIHVGGGTKKSWGPSTTGRDLDPYFGAAIQRGWARAGQGVAQSPSSFVDRLVMAESSGNPNAQSSTSSASGLGGFTNATWIATVRKHAGDVASGKSDAELLALKRNPEMSRKMAAAYASDNAGILKDAGIAVNDTNLYLAHFAGPGGAKSILKADDAAMLDSVLSPAAMQANPHLRGKTVGWIKSWAASKMGTPGQQKTVALDVAPDPRFKDMDYSKRLQLLAMADSTSKEIAAKDVAQQKAQYAALKDSFELAIVQGQTTEDAILNNPVLNDGDKASLIKSYRSEENTNGAAADLIEGIKNGTANVNPFDPDQTKAAEKAWDRMSNGVDQSSKGALMGAFVRATGYIPTAVQAEVRNALASTDAKEVLSGLLAASELKAMAPEAFSRMPDDVSRREELFSTYRRMGLDSEAATSKVVAANDPEARRTRDALLKSDAVKKEIKNAVEPSKVAALFDDSFMGLSRNPKLGTNGVQEAAISVEYQGMLEEAMAETGDMDAAKELAKDRFRKIYGVSKYNISGDDIVSRLPVEKAYPESTNGHEWVRDQAIAALKDEGIETDTVYFQPDDTTEKDRLSGKPPRYQLFYKGQNGAIEMFPVHFYAEVDAEADNMAARMVSDIEDARARNASNRAKPATIEEVLGARNNPLSEMDAAKKQFEQQLKDAGAN